MNAFAVANTFIRLYKENPKVREKGIALTLKGLLKRVYIAHGISLALYGNGMLDPQFDRVEAWQYGPVIPSVYHTFRYQNEDVQELTSVENKKGEIITPHIKDQKYIDIIKVVFDAYIDYSDEKIINITHLKGSPWSQCYKEGSHNLIPDYLTKFYYEKVLNLNL